MLTLLGSLFGIISGLLPEVLKYFKAKEDRKHELAVMTLQIEAQKQGHIQRLEEINTQADIAQEQIALQASKPEFIPLAGNWTDSLVAMANIVLALASGLVRPTITYCYFWLYALIKYAQYTIYRSGGQDFANAISGIWNQDDMAMLATVLTFWFSSRMFQKATARWGNK